MQWLELGISTAVSIGTGVGLWSFLPRGVVLTRETRLKDSQGNPLYDTWEVRNNSALPARLTSVSVTSPATFNEQTGEIEDLELPCSEGSVHGVGLSLDDDSSDIRRFDNETPWNEVVVQPGDTLQACISNNTSLTINYRRAGWMGLLERRSLTIHGYA